MTLPDPSTARRSCPTCGSNIPDDAPGGLCPRCALGRVAASAEAPTSGGTGPSTTAVSVEQVTAAFPQLEIASRVGMGGMGTVFKARQRHLDRWVALKVLPESMASRPAFVERFNREARVLARLNHPNIVTLHDFGQAGGLCYLLMEFVDGVNLRQAMRAGRFSPAQALALIPRICEALQFAHDEGVLHRDIKPENILLDARGRVKIADFGIAKLVGDAPAEVTLTASGASVGTPAYMAPEQIETPAAVDHRADIYSLGVVLYEMLTGELPLGRFPAPSTRGDADPRVDEIVLRALEKQREKRQQTADEVRTQVEAVTSASPKAEPVPPSVPPAEARPASQPKRNAKAVWAAAFSALSLGLATFVGVMFQWLRGRMLEAPVANFAVLVLGVFALLALGLGLAGMGLGFVAHRELRRRAPRQSGRGFAWFAMWAWPSLLVVLMLLVALLVQLKGARHSGVVTQVAPPGPDPMANQPAPVVLQPELPSPTVTAADAAADLFRRKRLSDARQLARNQVRVEVAQENYAITEARYQNGKATSLEMAQASRDLKVAKALFSGDAVAAARARLTYAEAALTEMKKKVEVGLEPPLAARTAESEVTLARLDLEEALEKSAQPDDSTPPAAPSLPAVPDGLGTTEPPAAGKAP